MIIEDGKNGFIVPCGDYKVLAERMCELAEDIEKAERFSREAVKITEKFEASEIYCKWKKFISALVRKDEEKK